MKATTDKKSLTQCNSILKEANSKLQDLHHQLQDLNAGLTENTTGITYDFRIKPLTIKTCIITYLLPEQSFPISNLTLEIMSSLHFHNL